MKTRNRNRRIEAAADNFNYRENVYTYTGRLVAPRAFDLSMPTIIDIAHALSNIPRYNGQSHEFYSVAQHCCMLAAYSTEMVSRSPADSLYMLMHDAAEAYIGDMVSPLKRCDEYFTALDDQIMAVIWKWLGIDHHPVPTFLDDLDHRICVDEIATLGLLGRPPPDLMPLGIHFETWSADHAEKSFLTQYTAYMYGVHEKIFYSSSEWQGFETASDDPYVKDLLEVDFLGNVGRVKVRNEDDNVLERDRTRPYPVPRWRWMHGEFTMMRGSNVIRKGR